MDQEVGLPQAIGASRRHSPCAAHWITALTAAVAMSLALPVRAHVGGDGFMGLDALGSGLQGEWILSRAAAARAAGNDKAVADDQAGDPNWIAHHGAAVAAAVLMPLHISRDGSACALDSATAYAHEDRSYVVLRFAIRCPVFINGELTLHDTAPIEEAAVGQHVVRLRDGAHTQIALLDGRHREVHFSLEPPARWPLFASFVRDGITHIANGLDHLLFLAALLLPAVLRYDAGRWKPKPLLKGVLTEALKIVTAFTLAHSLTLALAVLQQVHLPSGAVESAIAASVMMAAFDNLRPCFLRRRWWAVFAFGLIHGMGFASALTNLKLPSGSLAVALVGFNTGVELGQAALVGALLPLAFALRGTRFYSLIVLKGGSAVVTAWAGLWFIERVFGVQVLPPAMT